MKNQANGLLKRVDARLAACAAAAGASLAVAPSAHAAIVYSGAVNINIPVTIEGVYLNVVTGASGSNAASVVGWDVNPWSSDSLRFFSSPSVGSTYVGLSNNVFNLAAGTLINSGSGFTGVTQSVLSTPSFNSSNNFVGFQFQNEAAGNQTQYGWLQISLGATLTSPRAIVGYAYEDTGAGINAGATGRTNSVPDEGNTVTLLALTALGAVGVRAWRQRKAA